MLLSLPSIFHADQSNNAVLHGTNYVQAMRFAGNDVPYVIEALQYQSDVQDKLYLNITSYPVLNELAHQPVKEFGFQSSITLDTTCQSVKCTLYILVRTYNHHHLNKTK